MTMAVVTSGAVTFDTGIPRVEEASSGLDVCVHEGSAVLLANLLPRTMFSAQLAPQPCSATVLGNRAWQP